MRALYSLGIHLYALMVELLSPFHRKARMTRFGQWKTNGILREKIDRNAKYIWFHAASLGEFEQGRPMMEKIKAEYPEYKILLTFFSPSGYEVRKSYSGADVICYLPFDTPFKVHKFINLANPAMAIFIKYEFWMNYISELKSRNIPVYIISAIFRKDQTFFKWYGGFYRKILYCYDRLFVQDESSRELLAEFGINNVTVAGDTRFDRVIEVQKQARLFPVIEKMVGRKSDDSSITFVVGSSWPSDEEFIFHYFNEHPEIKLIIAPHEIHRDHLMYIESLLRRPFIRLSETNDYNVQNKDCLIIDSFGMLSSIYRYGNIAYIGGGFGKGIHNTLEAAVYGIPVLFGPKYHKFKEAKALIETGGAFSLADEKTFIAKMDELITNPSIRKAVGEAAGSYVLQNSGATDRILKELPL